MRERPILFNGPMVRAILAGAKTQTRRAMKNQPQPVVVPGLGPMLAIDQPRGQNRWLWPNARDEVIASCPYGRPGDLLWVRENGLEHRRTRLFIHDATPGRWWTPEDGGRYGASYGPGITRQSLLRDHKVRPSIHMPRWACRLVLEITNVRVERLQAISEADATAEGVTPSLLADIRLPRTHPRAERPMAYSSNREVFADLWDSTGGDWSANPWVWVIEFRQYEQQEQRA
ncbi:hypothetical protein AB8810_10885 [Xanthomonas sp. NCPPB 3005]|uniref:hypothetical protein n=1 Tax=Xanthomonas sp. NCPPB 3005 TaxID=3240913 RepID=UPI003519B76F